MDDLFILSCYLGVVCLVLAVGGVISDHLFPHIPFIANWLNGLPDYEDECEVSKIIDFPGEYAGGCWGIWAIRSPDSIFGAAESWVKVRGELLVYSTYAEAAGAAEAYNVYVGTENISYTPKAV